VQTVQLGNTGLTVTKVGFGGIPIQRLSESDAVAVIRHALDRGVNWIDTANGYAMSEERIGLALRGRDRETFRIFSKAMGETPEELGAQVELSFERLGVDTIDLYQFHIVPSIEAWGRMQKCGAVDLLLELKKQGRIRHIGASAHRLSVMMEIVKHPAVEVVQWPFNFIMAEEGLKVLGECRARGAGFIAMKPFGGGVLGDAAACIGFLMQYPDVITDPGFETVAEVDEVVSLAERPEPLSEHVAETIERLRGELGTRFCRRCGYCSPCPQGVAIVPLMTMESLVKRFSREQALSGWIGDGGRSAGKCTECGECEEKCPYELPIREQIKIGAELFRQLEGG